jgi:hypothetical protein
MQNIIVRAKLSSPFTISLPLAFHLIKKLNYFHQMAFHFINIYIAWIIAHAAASPWPALLSVKIKGKCSCIFILPLCAANICDVCFLNTANPPSLTRQDFFKSSALYVMKFDSPIVASCAPYMYMRTFKLQFAHKMNVQSPFA